MGKKPAASVKFSPISPVFLLLALVACRADAEPSAKPESNPEPKTTPVASSPATSTFEVCGNSFDLEISKTNETRAKGLMFRKKVDPDKGMIFIFRDERPQTFWMKNVPIGLDILYFDKKGQLVSSQTMEPASPLMKDMFLPRYASQGSAQFVVELAAGSFAKWPPKQLENCKLSPLPKIDDSVEP